MPSSAVAPSWPGLPQSRHTRERISARAEAGGNPRASLPHADLTILDPIWTTR